MSPAQATERLRAMVAASAEPALTDDELSDLLAGSIRVRVWAAGSVYLMGDLILPSSADPEAAGALYVATQAGICSDTEPTWPRAPYADVFSGGAAFRLLGAYDGCQWDMGAAAQMGWLRKAAMAAGAHDFKDGDQSFTRSQICEACLKMASLYGPAVIF